MSKFSVGEIAVYYSPEPSPESNGLELTILSAPEETERGLEYEVSGFEGDYDHAFEFCLRKKKPPKEEASWKRIEEIIGWNPTEKVEA